MDIKFNMEEMAYIRNKDINGSNIYLMFRPIGKEDREIHLTPRIMGIESGGTFIMDFRSIKLVDVSYIDEILLITLNKCSEGQYGDRYIAVTGMNEGVRNNLEAAIAWRLEKYKMFVPVVNKDEGKSTIIGALEKTLLDTYNFVKNKGCVTAKDLTTGFDIDQRNANTRLKRLYDYRLLKRKEDNDNANSFLVYSII